MGCTGSVSDPSNSGATVDLPSVFKVKYDWGRKYGEGGFASVSVATDKASGVQYAAKTINLKVGHVSAHATACLLGRAKDEVAVWKSLRVHDHIVRLHEVIIEPAHGAKAGYYIIVMELCDASLLERLNDTRALESAGISRIFREMLFGMQHMHSTDVCHRDIKPANLLLGGETGYTVKICDFGFSTVIPKDGISLKACGSPSYMSPEVAGNQVFTTNTDVWSAGVTCYVVLFGCLPYTNPAGDVRDVIIKGVPDPEFKVLPDIEPQEPPSGSTNFVQQMLVRDAKQRCSAEHALYHTFVRSSLNKLECDGSKDKWHEELSCAALSTICPESAMESLESMEDVPTDAIATMPL